MQSKNVLWLGLLFVLLLTTFCITKYIDQFHPSIQTVTTTQPEIIDKAYQQEQKALASKQVKEDDAYLQVVKMVEQEEQKIEDAFNQAVLEEQNRTKKHIQKQPLQATSTPVTKVIQAPKKIEPVKQKKSITPTPRKVKKRQKVIIEQIDTNEIFASTPSSRLSKIERSKLQTLVQKLRKDKTLQLRLEGDQKSKKFTLIKRYIHTLGVSQREIEISKSYSTNIEISLIKKDS
ncbi:MAG: hypothetical protein K0U47_10205 [Epsilonproteobacteria bacterium]|nr:hypothetical protein [Campylobacterota bacterium]